jgi:NADH-quinone oxidoreductase subunit G
MQANAETLVILENDLYRRLPRADVDRLLSRFRHIVAIDCVETEITERAELVLPSATFAEGDGTYVSYETRAQRAYQAFVPPEPIQESWRWLADWNNLDEAVEALARTLPQFAGVEKAAPPAGFRIEGSKIAREPHRFSGRTAIFANITVQEPPPPPDPDSPLNFSMEGAWKQPPPPVLPFFWNPGWNSIQSVNKFQSEIGDSLRGGDNGVRLIEPQQRAPQPFPDGRPRFEPRPGEWLVIPMPHVFGSEELSRLAPGIAQLSPEPYIALNRSAASEFGDRAEFMGQAFPVKVMPELPDGVAGVPSGIGPFAGLDLPLRAPIGKLP